MKWLIPAVLLGGFVVASLFLRAGGFTQIAPAGDSSGWDGQRRAFHQASVVVSDDQGNSVTHHVTLFGTAPDILEPWLELEFSMDSCELRPLGGRAHSIDVGKHTAWRAPGGEWVVLRGAFPDLEPFSREWQSNLDADLFGALRQRFPDEADLLSRIEQEIGATR